MLNACLSSSLVILSSIIVIYPHSSDEVTHVTETGQVKELGTLLACECVVVMFKTFRVGPSPLLHYHVYSCYVALPLCTPSSVSSGIF